MQITHNMRLVTLAIFVTAIAHSFMWQADADQLAPGTDVTTTTTTGVGKYDVPISTTTTRKTILDPGPVQEVIRKDTVYTRLSPADASQTIVETKDSNSIKYGRENYAERLRDFRSQLDNAIVKNLVSGAQVADLNSQYDSLVAQEASARSHSFPKAEWDDFDSHLNEFNIRLSKAMSKSTTK